MRSMYSSMYDITTDTATDRCNLVIVNAREAHAGLYACLFQLQEYLDNRLLDPGNFISLLGNYVTGWSRKGSSLFLLEFKRCSRISTKFGKFT